MEILLFTHKGPDIKIEIRALFENEDLLIDGYDIGKKVKEALSDSDYEYQLRVKAEHLLRLYETLNVKPGNKEKLLEELKSRYHTNSCYSDISKFLHHHNIPTEGFSWT